MEQSGLSREEIREIVVSRPRREGETSVDRVRISNRLHGICDRVIVRQYNPDLIFVAQIIDIYYVGARDSRVIVERRCGCKICSTKRQWTICMQPMTITNTSGDESSVAISALQLLSTGKGMCMTHHHHRLQTDHLLTLKYPHLTLQMLHHSLDNLHSHLFVSKMTNGIYEYKMWGGIEVGCHQKRINPNKSPPTVRTNCIITDCLLSLLTT